MTELFKLGKEQALKEIDKRLMEAMKPARDTGQLMTAFKQATEKRKGSGVTPPTVAQ